jgi:transcriptional regulator with XRE-family HTH domain
MDFIENDGQFIDVGNRLRQLRTDRDMSMRALARASGLSTNALSMIERSRTSPSVSTLYKLAEALEVPITAFFRLEQAKEAVVFRKAIERKRVDIGAVRWEGLGGESYTGHLEPLILTVESGGDSGSNGMHHTGHEFVFCLSGELVYNVNDKEYLLEAGDSLIFAAKINHSWTNRGAAPTTALVVLTGFEQDELPSEFHLQKLT